MGIRKRKPRSSAADRKEQRFSFQQHDSLGAEDALQDQQFLQDSFVYTSHYRVLRDVANKRSIVVGRTGAGKSALLLKLKDDVERGFTIAPESLALNFITNSTIIRFLLENGVRLDNFFRLLWRHVFAVEVIKNRYNLSSDNGQHWLLNLQYQFKIKSTGTPSGIFSNGAVRFGKKRTSGFVKLLRTLRIRSRLRSALVRRTYRRNLSQKIRSRSRTRSTLRIVVKTS